MCSNYEDSYRAKSKLLLRSCVVRQPECGDRPGMRGGSGIGVGGVDLVSPAWLSARAPQGKCVEMVGERCEWSNFWNVTRSENYFL